jgi:hypothetical protein
MIQVKYSTKLIFIVSIKFYIGILGFEPRTCGLKVQCSTN